MNSRSGAPFSDPQCRQVASGPRIHLEMENYSPVYRLPAEAPEGLQKCSCRRDFLSLSFVARVLAALQVSMMFDARVMMLLPVWEGSLPVRQLLW